MSRYGAECDGVIRRRLTDARVRSGRRHYAPSSASSRLRVHLILHRYDERDSVGARGIKNSPPLGVECEERGDRSKARPRYATYGAPRPSKGNTPHSYKLWHRAPSESGRSPTGLSHVRQTLESGVPAPPRSTSLDAAGQWLVCGAGTSPTEIPRIDPTTSRTAGSLLEAGRRAVYPARRVGSTTRHAKNT